MSQQARNSSRQNLLPPTSNYEIVRDLNSGTFGFVVLAKDKKNNNEQVAIKFLERGDKITKYVEREILNHRVLSHPHIIKFKEIFLTEKYLAIVMEYAEGGDMFDYVVKNNGLREDEARWFFQQLIVALDYCHRKFGIVNRDIKLENTLLGNGPVPLLKLCDFGYSKRERFHSAPGSRVGTPAYLAPEVILTRAGQRFDGKYADIWSCGVMLYVMLCGAYPFERQEDKNDPGRLKKMIQRILRVEYHAPANVSPECVDLFDKIFVADASKRIKIHELMSHPWFLKNLPRGVLQMNDQQQQAACQQPENEIVALVNKAREVPADSKQLFDDELDQYPPTAD